MSHGIRNGHLILLDGVRAKVLFVPNELCHAEYGVEMPDVEDFIEVAYVDDKDEVVHRGVMVCVRPEEISLCDDQL